MAVNKVDLTVSQLINDLNSGLTWLKKDDLGYGSVEVKYGANPTQIGMIRKHPALKDAETNITVFNVIDDTKSGSDYDIDVKKVSKPAPVVQTTPSYEPDDAANFFETL